MKRLIGISSAMLLMGSSMLSFGWNLDERYVNALRFDRDGTIQFTLFAAGLEGEEFICDDSVSSGGQWFVIKSCKIGKGKGNKSASSSCLSSVERQAEMLLQAKVDGIPVHVQRDLCKVTETALKPLPTATTE